MNRRNSNLTFNQILDVTKRPAAEAAWERARVASRLRHAAVKSGRHIAARKLAEIKLEAIKSAMRLAPETIIASIDDDYQVGLVSVRWPGRGSLHLPASCDLSMPQTAA